MKENNPIGSEQTTASNVEQTKQDVDVENEDNSTILKENEQTKIIVSDELDRERQKNKLNQMKQLYRITHWNYLFIIISITTYTSDVISDVMLAIAYFINHEWIYACCTLVIVVYLSIFNNLFNKNAMWWKAKRTVYFYLWIIPYFLLNVQPLIQLYKNLKTVKRYLFLEKTGDVDGQISEHKKFQEGYNNASILKLVEAIMEATPQLILQFYILASTSKYLEVDKKWLTMLAISTSLFGLWLTCCSFARPFHSSKGERVTILGAVLMAIGYAVPIVCRAVAVTCLLITTYWYLVLFYWIFHSALRTVWRRKYEEDRINFDSLAEGFVLIMQPSLRSIPQCVISNVILFFSDLSMFLIWGCTFGGEFHKKWIFLISFWIVDCACRSILVFYLWKKSHFTKKILSDETDLIE